MAQIRVAHELALGEIGCAFRGVMGAGEEEALAADGHDDAEMLLPAEPLDLAGIDLHTSVIPETG